MMDVTYNTALELASHEGLVRQAYKDSVGVWTWSIGLTNASGHNVDRYINNPQTIEKCLDVYVWALEKYAKDVRKAFASKPLNESQFAAALSFHYNTGSINKASWVKKWLAGDVAGAKKSFMDWRKPAEIIPRREKERDLFFDGKWSNKGTTTEYTRVKSNGQIDWSSAKSLNITKQMKEVFGDNKSDVNPVEEAPVVVVPVPVPEFADPGELETHPAKSKTVWTWALTAVGTVGMAIGDFLGNLDWRVQLFITAAIVCFAVYGIKRRADLFRSVKELKESFE